MALFMGALENTIVGTAMPTVVANLGGIHTYSWVFAAYILASTVMTPIWGKLADLFGRRFAMFGGLALFIIGSALAGASQSMAQLITFRIVQGLGASALFPVGMTIVADMLTLEQRAKVVGLFSGMWGIASLVGPTVGGYLTEYTSLSWRACFYIIIPAGLLSAAMIGSTYREENTRREDISFNYMGTIVLSAALVLLLFTVERSTKLPMSANVAALLVCILLFYFYVHIEKNHPEPLVPMELFRDPMVTMATLHGLFAMMALIGTMNFLPLFVQAVIGTSAIVAGNILMPFIISWVLTSIVAGRMILRFGYKPLVLTGMAAMLIGSARLAMVSSHTTQLVLSFDVILMGIGGGLVIVTLMIAAQHGVPRNQLGVTTSTVQFARNIGAAIGTAAMGAIMRARLQHYSTTGPADFSRLVTENELAMIVRPEIRAGLSGTTMIFLRDSLADALSGAFTFVFIIVIIGTVIAFFVPSGFAHELAYKAPSPGAQTKEAQAEDETDATGEEELVGAADSEQTK